MERFAEFLHDGAGAVTVDWVALTAGALLLGMVAVYAIYNTGVASLVVSVNDNMRRGPAAPDIGNLDDLLAQNTGTGG